MMIELPSDLVDMLRGASTLYLATQMPDGSPQLTQTWGDTDGTHVVVNSVRTHQKTRNLMRDPRIAVTVSDPANPSRYYALRGAVVSISEDGAREHIEALSQRYTGGPYPWYGGRDQVRVIFTIEAESIRLTG